MFIFTTENPPLKDLCIITKNCSFSTTHRIKLAAHIYKLRSVKLFPKEMSRGLCIFEFH